MERENCWVWFKGSLKGGGSWKGGFTYKKDENPGVLIQSPAYVQCRVPAWRIRTPGFPSFLEEKPPFQTPPSFSEPLNQTQQFSLSI